MALWRPVLDGFYEVSSLGDVRRGVEGRSTTKGRLLKQQWKEGYRSVCLSVSGFVRRYYVHRLIAEAFLGPCPLGMVVNHMDGGRSHNFATNLEYVRPAQNSQRAGINGQLRQGENHPAAKVTADDVRAMREAVRNGTSQADLCRKYKLNPCTMSYIVRGITWKSVKD